MTREFYTHTVVKKNAAPNENENEVSESGKVRSHRLAVVFNKVTCEKKIEWMGAMPANKPRAWMREYTAERNRLISLILAKTGHEELVTTLVNGIPTKFHFVKANRVVDLGMDGTNGYN